MRKIHRFFLLLKLFFWDLLIKTAIFINYNYSTISKKHQILKFGDEVEVNERDRLHKNLLICNITKNIV